MKPTQVSYQLYYRLRKKLGKSNFSKKLDKQPANLKFVDWISSPVSFKDGNTFSFLNKEEVFFQSIDWNNTVHGKLWTYNLNYFDFLTQQGLNKEEGLSLIKAYIHASNSLKDGLEPYPISLRGINWIKFLSKNDIQDQEINQILYDHYYTLLHNREYHLLGNHLLENGFSLLFGAYYFKDKTLLDAATTILRSELKEQLLQDGAHFELSPMYHQIILNRLLDCINLTKNNPWSEFKDLDLLTSSATNMLAWLETMTFQNGDIPMVNDSAWGIAPHSTELFDYAKRLELKWIPGSLKASGYRKWIGENYEFLMDVGAIGSDYIPGHAHADTFHFELYHNGKPFIIDTGTSTYEKNQLRQEERSTFAHNTVVVDGANSSHVWGGFRVAERARILKLEENENSIIGEHDGYKSLNCIHRRSFEREDKKLVINDTLISNHLNKVEAYLHFHPSAKNILLENYSLNFPDNEISIEFEGDNLTIEKIEFNYCRGFNNTENATAIKVTFQKHLKTTIAL